MSSCAWYNKRARYGSANYGSANHICANKKYKEDVFILIYERLRKAVDEMAKKVEQNPSQIFEEALDINFLVSLNGELIGGVLLLKVGSPDIYVDVTNRYVVGEISDYEYKVEISEKSFKTLYDILQQYYDIRIVLGKWFSP